MIITFDVICYFSIFFCVTVKFVNSVLLLKSYETKNTCTKNINNKRITIYKILL